MKSTTQSKSNSLRLSIQADLLSAPVGGGRFIRGFLRTVFYEENILDGFDHIYIIATQREPMASFHPVPPYVSILKRRFPVRLRQTPFARLFGAMLPTVDVAFGPFYHVFPSRARARVITVHDLTCFDEQYHPPIKAREAIKQLGRMVRDCDGIVCDSDTTLSDFKMRYPHYAHRAVKIYPGVSHLETKKSHFPSTPQHSILAVGTIEPRKNYPIILNAFEQLTAEQGDMAPLLTVIGEMGWLSETVAQRLLTLQAAGKCRWLRNATDEELAEAYNEAAVFTYLSLKEGFGYPPFEAAFAHCPMVLSKSSSVDEIWSGYAKCVNPLNVEEIVEAWKWALTLSVSQREALVARQEKRAREFTWKRAVGEYVSFWKRLLD